MRRDGSLKRLHRKWLNVAKSCSKPTAAGEFLVLSDWWWLRIMTPPKYSQLSLNGHSEADTSLRRIENLVPPEFHLSLCNWTFSKADTFLRRTTDTQNSFDSSSASYVATTAFTNVSESTEAKCWLSWLVFTFNKDEYDLWKLSSNFSVSLYSNHWLKIEVNAVSSCVDALNSWGSLRDELRAFAREARECLTAVLYLTYGGSWWSRRCSSRLHMRLSMRILVRFWVQNATYPTLLSIAWIGLSQC